MGDEKDDENDDADGDGGGVWDSRDDQNDDDGDEAFSPEKAAADSQLPFSVRSMVLRQAIKDIAAGAASGNQDECELPVGIEAEDRAALHAWCERQGLNHRTKGDDQAEGDATSAGDDSADECRYFAASRCPGTCAGNTASAQAAHPVQKTRMEETLELEFDQLWEGMRQKYGYQSMTCATLWVTGF